MIVNRGSDMGSTSKSFQLLQAIAMSGPGGARFSEIVRLTSVPKSTAHRLLNELADIGAVRYDSSSKTYAGGLLLARHIRGTVRPHLKKLHDDTGHTVTLGIRDGEHGVYIDKIENQDFGIRLHSEIGKAFPLHCTGIGKALLAQLSPGLLATTLPKRLEALTPDTITSKKQLRADLAEIRERGYALDDGEVTRGLLCIAAPVFGPDGAAAGALSCTLPTYIRDEIGIEKEVQAVLQAAAAASGQIV
jgi:IclR family acetate operon transcriptional repressor